MSMVYHTQAAMNVSQICNRAPSNGTFCILTNPTNDTSQSCSTSSSIGENSSCTSLGSAARASDDEAESCLQGPLEGMASLRAFLPPRIGLSRFIGGKSQSFTCLADVCSIKNLAKPEDPYSRRRRSYKHSADAFGRQRFPPRTSASRISKKSVCSSRSNLALALAMALKTRAQKLKR